MAMVDEFLDELTDDYTALYKENAALKAKLKVLVEKVEDYRATEDSMRATLLTAQKMADSIVHEAEAEAGRDPGPSGDRAPGRRSASCRQRGGGRRGAAAPGPAGAGPVHRRQPESICEKELKFLEQLPELPVEARGAGFPAGAGGGRPARSRKRCWPLSASRAWRRKPAPARSGRGVLRRRRTTIRRGTPLRLDPVDEPTRRIQSSTI